MSGKGARWDYVELALNKGGWGGRGKVVEVTDRCYNSDVESLKVCVEDRGRIEDLGQEDLVETRT